MKILNIENKIETLIRWILPTAPLGKAFSHLRTHEGHSAGYTWPMHAARGAINLLWLQWHKDVSFDEIQNTIEFVIKRGIQANNDSEANQSCREEHDNFLIQLAILCGNKRLINKVCDSVIEADTKSKEYQYLQAWTGILKYRFSSKDNEVIKQYEIMRKFKSTRIFLWPQDKLVQTFVERDYKEFNKILKRSCERQWKWSEKEKAITKETNGEIILDVTKRHDHFMWPWVEGAFAKLAYMDGAEITHDSPWLPLDLIKAIS